MIEGVIVIAGVFLVMFFGLSFIVKCNRVKLKQQFKLRSDMYTMPSEKPPVSFSFENIASYMSRTACSEKLMTEPEEVKIPGILLKSNNIKNSIRIESCLYILRGSWNSQQLVDKIKGTQFEGGSIENMLDNAYTGKEYQDEEEKYVIE